MGERQRTRLRRSLAQAMSEKDRRPATRLLPTLLGHVPDGEIREVRIGLHWTAVVARVQGKVRCGLCSTLSAPHDHGMHPQVPNAGKLERMTSKQLAAFAVEEENPTLTSVGVATLNALLPAPPENLLVGGNAEQILATHGCGKRVVIVGNFPFIPRLRENVERLDVLELRPREDDLPAQSAPEVIPQAQIVAITSMSLANHTLADLLELCSPEATVLLLGPSTPLSPLLFDFGIDLLSGSLVEAIEPVLKSISQGANFRQVHQAGVRLITIAPAAAEWLN
jgi:uncharacterized protein (DUF4213/DUF364 family)